MNWFTHTRCSEACLAHGNRSELTNHVVIVIAVTFVISVMDSLVNDKGRGEGKRQEVKPLPAPQPKAGTMKSPPKPAQACPPSTICKNPKVGRSQALVTGHRVTKTRRLRAQEYYSATKRKDPLTAATSQTSQTSGWKPPSRKALQGAVRSGCTRNQRTGTQFECLFTGE